MKKDGCGSVCLAGSPEESKYKPVGISNFFADFPLPPHNKTSNKTKKLTSQQHLKQAHIADALKVHQTSNVEVIRTRTTTGGARTK